MDAMSLEAALDEERRSVLMLLGDNNQAKPRRRMPSRSSDMARSPSPFTSPRSPVRSMQDLSDLVGDGEIPPPSTSSRSTSSSIGTRIASPQRAPIRSMLDIGPAPKKAAPPVQPVRSMLDLDSPPASAGPRASASSLTRSAQTSPTETHRQPSGGGSPGTHPRSASDQASKSPADFGPRSSASRLADPTSEYQFSGIISTQTGQSLPRPRGSASSKRSSVMADVMRGSDIQSLILPGDVRGRPAFIVGGVGVSSLRSARNGSSRSPHGRLGTGRSNSPHSSLLSGSLSSPLGASKGSGTSSLAVLDDGRVVDLNNAFRHLSDAKLVLNGPAHLAELSRKKQARQGSAGRLEKDYLGPEGEDLLEDSSEDDRTDSSGDEGEQRGRTTAPRSVDGGGTAGQTDKRGAAAGARGPETSSRKVSRSQLAAAEEERKYGAQSRPRTS